MLIPAFGCIDVFLNLERRFGKNTKVALALERRVWLTGRFQERRFRPNRRFQEQHGQLQMRFEWKRCFQVALERRVSKNTKVELALEQRFEWKCRFQVALEWRFSKNTKVELALERRFEA